MIATSEEDPVLAVVRFSSELAWADAGPEVSLFPSRSLFLLLTIFINCAKSLCIVQI